MLIAAATVLLLAGAAVAAKIIIDLGAVVVEVTPSRPGLLPTPSIAPTGEPITLEEAAVLLGKDVAFPTRLGRPDRVWADQVFTEFGQGPAGHDGVASATGSPGDLGHTDTGPS